MTNPRLEAAKERLRRPDPFREGGNGCCYPESCPATRALLRVLEANRSGRWDEYAEVILDALEGEG